MRILYFSRDYSTHDHRFLSALARTAHQVHFLRLERRGHPLEDRALPPEIEIVHWKGGADPARLLNGPGLLFDLKRVIHEVQPDLIQAGPIQRSALLVALAGFRPLVSMSWGYDLLIDARRNAFWEWATRYTLKRSAALVGDCETIRRQAASFGMPDQRIVTFPWGIDLEHFRPAASRPETASDAPFTLLSTRGWEPVYGVDLIAQAFAKAASAQPELRLVMLGNGSLAGRLRQILSGRGLIQSELGASNASTHRVLFPGQVGYQDLPRFYRSADLYISASHSDGTSISLLEAMACGLPAIVSDIPGNREWVEQGVNGWLFPEGDADGLSRAILSALEQRRVLPEMGRRARQIAEERADWHANFPKLFCAYEIAQKY
jgi:glycosyltransferase involved in cell wall biosynthesis